MITEPNGQKIRSLATQTALMDAAEILIAEKGIHNVSVKNIMRAAGQKNESALQYHFRNLQGLVDAITTRTNPFNACKNAGGTGGFSQTKPTLRELCELMVW